MRAHVCDVTPDLVTEGLRRDGYAIIDGVLDAADVANARDDLQRVLERTPPGRNDFEGCATRRVYALFKKTRAFDAAAVHPLVLGVLDRLLGHYHLSAPVGIQIGPGEKAQVLHRDEAVYPLPRPHSPVVVNTMWPMDDFTRENGATCVVAGSHRWAPERLPGPADERVVAEMPAGSMMFYLGNLWHGGGANRTQRPRLAVLLA